MDCQPKWRNRVDDGWRALQRVLWPPLCLLCGGVGTPPSTDLCRGCEGDLVPLGAGCARCAHPLADGVTGQVCGDCLRRPPPFQRSFCAFRYEAPLDELVRAFKYRGNTASGRVLAKLFCDQLNTRPRPLPECIVPVPLSPRRYRDRGFNQAIELGTHIERQLRVPLRADVLIRIRDTAEQAGLKPLDRRRNVRRAFALARPFAATHVAILDDVMTTGSTVSEVARVLRRAGVQDVEVWAIARAGRR